MDKIKITLKQWVAITMWYNFDYCKIAVAKEGYALRFVQEQTDEICKIAVAKEGYALKYVQKQTDEICKIAVAEDLNALPYVKKEFLEVEKEIEPDSTKCTTFGK